MESNTYTKAVEKKEKLIQQLNDLRAEAKAIERSIANIDLFIATWHELTGSKGVTVTFSKPKAPNPKNPPRDEVGNLAEEILLQHGRPMLRTSLFKAIQERGMTIYGKDPEMVFSTMMWRMRERFVRVKNKGYWVRKKACPAVGYDPNMTLVDDMFE